MELKRLQNLTILSSLILIFVALLGVYTASLPLSRPAEIMVGEPQLKEKLVLGSDRDGSFKRYLSDPDGSNLITVDWYENGRFLSVSPNGRKISYYKCANINHDCDVWIMDSNGQNQTLLADINSDWDMRASFSPDGSQLVYGKWPGELYIINIDGTNNHLITQQTYAEWPNWGKDNIIYFNGITQEEKDIWKIYPDGTGLAKVGGSPDQDGNPIECGNYIFFNSGVDQDNSHDIRRMNKDGTEVTMMTSNSTLDFLKACSPDKTRIIYEHRGRQQDNDADLDIYIMNVNDDNNIARITDNNNEDYVDDWAFIETMIEPTTTPAPTGYPSTSEKIFFNTNRSGKDEIYTMDINGSNQTLLLSSDQSVARARLSPDGTKIAYSKQNGNGKWDLWIADSDGTNETKLDTVNSTSVVDSRWSPDGQYLVYNKWEYELFIIKADGTGKTLLVNLAGGHAAFPYWDSDGFIYFGGDKAGDATNFIQIWKIKPDGSGLALVGGIIGDHNDFPFICGDKVIFGSGVKKTNGEKINRMDKDGQNIEKMTPTDKESGSIARACSPDGTRIAFLSNREDRANYEAYTMNLSDKSVVRLTNNPQEDMPSDWGYITGETPTPPPAEETLTPTPPPVDTNLITNPSFEIWDSVPLSINHYFGQTWIRGVGNWGDWLTALLTKRTDKPNEIGPLDPNEPNDGDNVLFMYSQANMSQNWLRYENNQSLTAGEYTLSGMAKPLIVNGRGVTIDIACGQTACGTLSQNTVIASITFDQLNTWEEKSTAVTIPADAAYYVRLMANDGSQAYFDKIGLIKGIAITPTLTPMPTGELSPTPTPTPTTGCGDSICTEEEQYTPERWQNGTYCYYDCCTLSSTALTVEKGDLNKDCVVNSLDWGIMHDHWTPASAYPYQTTVKPSLIQSLIIWLKSLFGY